MENETVPRDVSNLIRHFERIDPEFGPDEIITIRQGERVKDVTINKTDDQKRLLNENNSLKIEIARLKREHDFKILKFESASDMMTDKIVELINSGEVMRDNMKGLETTIDNLKRSNDRVERSHMVHTKKVEQLSKSEDLLKRSLKHLQEECQNITRHNAQLLAQKKLDEQKIVHQRECECFKKAIKSLRKELGEALNKQTSEIASKDGRYYMNLIGPLIKDIDRLRKAVRQVYKKCDRSLQDEISQIYNRSGDFVKTQPEKPLCFMDLFKKKCEVNLRWNNGEFEGVENKESYRVENYYLIDRWDRIVLPYFNQYKTELTNTLCKAIGSFRS